MEDDFDLFDDTEIPGSQRRPRKLLPLTSTEGRRQNYILNSKFKYTTTKIMTVDECELILKDMPAFESRHTSFKTKDVSVKLHPNFGLIETKTDLVLRYLEQHLGFETGDLYLLDCFIVKYDYLQKGLEAHTDGCILSFNIQLNNPNEFQGGGTRFTELDTTIKLEQGQCLLHSAKILHQGMDVHQGTRIILVGFVETGRKGILSKQSLFNQDLKNRNII